MFIIIQTLLLKSLRVTPTLELYQLGACTWLGVGVSELVVIAYKGFLIIGCLLSGLMMCTQHTLQMEYIFYNKSNGLRNRIHTYKLTSYHYE